MPNSLTRLVYRSVSRVDVGDVDALSDILATASRNNRRLRVTGALVAVGQSFVQILEGRRVVVHALLERLRADPRHEGVCVLGEISIRDRLFANWAMAKGDPSGLAPQALLILTRTGTAAQVAGVVLSIIGAPILPVI